MNDCPKCKVIDGLPSDPEIEAMLRFLCRHANHFTIITSNFDISIYSAWSRVGTKEPLRFGHGPTLREALASACDWVKQEQQQPH